MLSSDDSLNFTVIKQICMVSSLPHNVKSRRLDWTANPVSASSNMPM
jgi:hypothetical protein